MLFSQLNANASSHQRAVGMKLVSVAALLLGIHFGISFAFQSSSYEFVCSAYSDDILVSKYRSKSSGITVITANIEGPLIHGYLTVGTFATSDDGLPHTLEHLIFLGSEDYPYKGVLDLLANRCFADGTNAWTGIDDTTYTVFSAGSEGFLNLLPVYAEHLLYPTLTDAAYITEVYHINEDGEDAGVVYSEMQAIENTAESRTVLALQRALYPEPSGYRYETGGIMKNLRDSTSNEKVKSFHRRFYQPNNLHIIVTGKVKPQEIFQSLESLDQKILSKGPREPFVSPWLDEVPFINVSQDIEVFYPSDIEDTGIVFVGWRGSSAINNINKVYTLQVLLEFLCYSSVSPLTKVFVETNSPLSTEVENGLFEFFSSSFYLKFNGVPISQLDQVKPLLFSTLSKLAYGEMEFDMENLSHVIKNLILRQQSKLESSPHSTVANQIIRDALYGQTCYHMEQRLNKSELYKSLLNKTKSFWVELLKMSVLDSPSVTVRGVPSISYAKLLEEETKQRVGKRKKELQHKLAEFGEQLKAAVAQNEIAPPDEVLSSLPIPGVESLNFHYISSTNNFDGNPDALELPVPFKFQINDVHSKFVKIIMLLDTTELAYAERLYIPLLLELVFESDIERNGSVVPHTDVIKEFDINTINRYSFIGVDLNGENLRAGPFFSNLVLDVMEVLYKIKLSSERIEIKAKKLLSSIGEKKREGMAVARLLSNGLVYAKECNKNAVNMLIQQKFLSDVLRRLESNQDALMADVLQVYKKVTSPEKITVIVSTNVSKLTDIGRPWKTFAEENFIESKDRNLSFKPDFAQKLETDSRVVTGYVAGIGSIESAYLIQTTSCITDYNHPDLAVIMTAISYLTQLEGPMWKEIRGQGLAYHYSIKFNPVSGTLSLYLAKAAQLVDAYFKTCDLLDSYINDTAEWSLLLHESAKTSLVYEIVNRESTISKIVEQSVVFSLKKLPLEYNRNLVKKIMEVDLESIKKAVNKYIKPLIDSSSSVMAVTCQPDAASHIVESFKRKGHNLKEIKSLEDSYFATL